jgi:ribonuclease T1
MGFRYHLAFEFQGNPVSFPAQRLAWRDLRKSGLAVGVGIGVAVLGLLPAGGSGKQPGAAAVESVARADLPAEALATERLIRSGGPFAHARDGAVFGNFERRLPAEPRGYYHEYTVRTPGLAGRGARRIVCGGARPANPEACYYSSDHYANFRRIVQ